MIWFILIGLIIITTIIFTLMGLLIDPEFLYANIITGFLLLMIGVPLVANIISLKSESKQFEYLDVNIENKLSQINQMKKSFRNVQSGSQFNIDMVNKDLTLSIADKWADLERFIITKNNRIAQWQVNYDNRFWNHYYVKPPRTKPIILSDYLKEERSK